MSGWRRDVEECGKGKVRTYLKVSRLQRPVSASENLPICRHLLAKSPKKRKQIHILAGSSMRRIVPETQAALRGIMNSKPSLETNVTNSETVTSAMLEGCSRVVGGWRIQRVKGRSRASTSVRADNDKRPRCFPS